MKFADFIRVQAIKADLIAEDKDGAIHELVAGLVESKDVLEDEQESIIKAIMKREELGSTGIGRGVAVPHTKHPSVNRLIGTVGVSVEGVDFNSLDGEKVQLFFLLISPPDRPGDQHVSSAARRHVLSVSQAGKDVGGRAAVARGSGQ
jgi:PTS system nitrogen regulatory IIA component